MASRTWVDYFRDIEKVMLFIKPKKYKSALNESINKLNHDYNKQTHSFHVNALNFGLKKHLKKNKDIDHKDVDPNMPLDTLRNHIRVNFIDEIPSWQSVFKWVEINFIPIIGMPYSYAKNLTFITINPNYNKQQHSKHVKALNNYLSPYMRSGRVILDDTFNQNITITMLQRILRKRFIRRNGE